MESFNDCNHVVSDPYQVHVFAEQGIDRTVEAEGSTLTREGKNEETNYVFGDARVDVLRSDHESKG